MSKGDVLVKFKTRAPQSERARRGRTSGDASARIQEPRRALATGEGCTTVQAIERLRRNPHVEYAEPDYLVQAVRTPNDPSYPSQWG